MVWTCAQEGSGVYREKDVEGGAARQEEKRKAKEEVHGCGAHSIQVPPDDFMRADMRVVGVSMEDVEDRAKWRRLIRCGDP